MSDVEQANDEGDDPALDIKKQNAGQGATGQSDDKDHSDHKTQDLVKAGRPEMDPDAGAE